MLKLYGTTVCPSCRRVLEFARKHNIELEEKDISTDEQSVKEILKIGGKRQVPFLVDESANISMYESEEIIDYLKQKYVKESSPLD